MQIIQNLTLQKILEIFKTTLILLIELESALFSITIRLNYSQKRYAFRISKLNQNYFIYKKFKNVIRLINKKFEIKLNININSLNFNFQTN